MATGPGILYVLSDPGPKIPEDEFHNWYNNEHGPDRMRLSGMISGLRYRAIDGESPPWLATYEMDDLALLQRPVYTRLRENRSPHEAHIVSDIAVLDRHIYKLVASRGAFEPEPASIALAVNLTVPADSSSDVENWYIKEHIDLLARVPGWLRSRLLVSNMVDQSGSKYLAIHEYKESNGLGGPEHEAARSTPWRTRIMSVVRVHRRIFGLHRIFSKIPNDLEHLPSGVPPVIDSFYPREDDVKLHYRLEGNPTGPVIVFSNSLMTDFHIWDKLIPQISPRFKILRYDTRGHGLSPSAGDSAKLSDLSADILSLLSALNIMRIHALVGVSLGGATAMHLALHNPGFLSCVVAADCNFVSTPSNNAAWDERIALARSTDPGSGLPELARQTLARWFLPVSVEPQPNEDAQSVETMITSTSLSGFIAGARALCDYDLRGQLPSLQIPALFVAGEGDGVLPTVMKEFASKAPGAQFLTVENAGHLPMVENPGSFWKAIEPFLECTK